MILFIMKQLNVFIEDEIHEKMVKAKHKMNAKSWKEFFDRVSDIVLSESRGIK